LSFWYFLGIVQDTMNKQMKMVYFIPIAIGSFKKLYLINGLTCIKY
jgi:hypothetical protein